MDSKIRSGYRVIGANTADGRLSVWYYPTEEDASSFAKFLAETTGLEVDVVKYIGSWKRQEIPVEYIKSKED